MTKSKISTDEITCPYCNHKHRDLVDYQRFEENEEFECENCERIFIIAKIDHCTIYYTKPKAVRAKEKHEKNNDNGE